MVAKLWKPSEDPAPNTYAHNGLVTKVRHFQPACQGRTCYARVMDECVSP